MKTIEIRESTARVMPTGIPLKKAHLDMAHPDLPNFCLGYFFEEALNYRYPTSWPQAKLATGR